MTRKLHNNVFASFRLKTASCVFAAAFVFLVSVCCPSHVEAADITLTKIGSPIWRPTDFQMFTAPTAPFPDAFFDTLDALLPLEGPGAATYTPHQAPYDTELSTNAAAAGFVQQTVFPRNAITLDPNGVYLAMMWLPDPGVTGSSRDFASGPVIPNSLFPFTSFSEIFLGGVKVETLQDQMVNIRAGDVGFTGASHRAPSQVVWHPWADDPNAGPLGNYEIRWQLRDIQGNGWNIVSRFQVVPEPCAFASAAVGVLGFVVAGRRSRRQQWQVGADRRESDSCGSNHRRAPDLPTKGA